MEKVQKPVDRRVLKTKRAIRNAFAKLMVEKDINDITVMELSETADINRKTFYNYYSGVYQVVEDIENDIISSYERLLGDVQFRESMNAPYQLFERFSQLINMDPEFFGYLLTMNGNIALISAGWDPGLFSLNRLYASAVLPDGKDYTFWGRGVSQGHSDAIRRIDGVLDARQYTVPIPAALDAVRSGSMPELSTREKHLRECYVVAAEGADKARIEREIKEMPNYFSDYDTTVTFITTEEMLRDHAALPHGGFVIRTGKIGLQKDHTATIEYSLRLDSNPEFTSSVLVACARAILKMAVIKTNRGGQGRATTVFSL